MKLRDILGVLRDAYCRRVGIEYMHIQDPAAAALDPGHGSRSKYRSPTPRRAAAHPRPAQRGRGVRDLPADQVRRPEAVQPRGRRVDDPAARRDAPGVPADAGLDEVVIGMAHRGRLNVLANIVGKPYGKIFSEFEGHLDPRTVQGSGDVKYHLGTEGTFTSAERQADHGLARRQPVPPRGRRPGAGGHRPGQAGPASTSADGFTVLPLCARRRRVRRPGRRRRDAATSPSCAATAPAARCTWSSTTRSASPPPPEYSRSSLYSTDVARMIQAPIFHVNGDDPEAVVRVAQLAFEYRAEFNKDVVIDMVCYRRRGHNEGDDPSMTQPLMYNIIDAKRSVRKLYTEALVGRGDITDRGRRGALRDFQAAARAGLQGHPRRGHHAAPSQPTAPRGRAGARRSTPRSDADRGQARSATRTSTRRRASPPHKRSSSCSTGARDGRRRRHRLGLRRAHRVRFAAARGDARAAGRPGLAPGHVRPAARRRSSTPKTGEDYLPLARSQRREQARFWVYDSLLSRVRGDGLRVRLLGRAHRRPGAAGRRSSATSPTAPRSSIDEFISSGEEKWGQRSSGHPAAAARLRGPGSGPLVRPPRAVPAAVRREQHDGGHPVHPGDLLPPAAPPGPVAAAQAAGRVHAEVAAAAQALRVAGGGLHHRHLPAGHRRHRRARPRSR